MISIATPTSPVTATTARASTGIVSLMHHAMPSATTTHPVIMAIYAISLGNAPKIHHFAIALRVATAILAKIPAMTTSMQTAPKGIIALRSLYALRAIVAMTITSALLTLTARVTINVACTFSACISMTTTIMALPLDWGLEWPFSIYLRMLLQLLY